MQSCELFSLQINLWWFTRWRWCLQEFCVDWLRPSLIEHYMPFEFSLVIFLESRQYSGTLWHSNLPLPRWLASSSLTASVEVGSGPFVVGLGFGVVMGIRTLNTFLLSRWRSTISDYKRSNLPSDTVLSTDFPSYSDTPVTVTLLTSPIFL